MLSSMLLLDGESKGKRKRQPFFCHSFFFICLLQWQMGKDKEEMYISISIYFIFFFLFLILTPLWFHISLSLRLHFRHDVILIFASSCIPSICPWLWLPAVFLEKSSLVPQVWPLSDPAAVQCCIIDTFYSEHSNFIQVISHMWKYTDKHSFPK